MTRYLLMLSAVVLTSFALMSPAVARKSLPDGAAHLKAEGLTRGDVQRLDAPVVVDRRRALRDVRDLERELRSLHRMMRGVRDRGLRADMKESLGGIERRLDRMREEMERAAPLHLVGRPRLPKPPVVRHVPPPPKPATAAEVQRLIKALEDTAFAEDKHRVLKSAVADRFFTCAQAVTLSAGFPFDDDRVTALALLFERVVDPENAHVLYPALTYASGRAELERRVEAIKARRVERPTHRARQIRPVSR